MINIRARHRIISFLVGSLLLLVLAVDLIIFGTVTGRPLDLAPSDLSTGPKIQTPTQAAPAVAALQPEDPSLLVPALTFQPVKSNRQAGIQVIGFGRGEHGLYLQLRLYASLDLSLKKGWGKAIQLLDDTGNHYLYNSYTLPAGVRLYDPLVDLPDDLRANLPVVLDGYKDLYLSFPDFPAGAVPVQLRIIEAFQGNSPANPGIIYQTVEFTPEDPPREQGAIKALTTMQQKPDTRGQWNLGNTGRRLTVNTIWLGDDLFPRLSCTVSGPGAEVILKNCILIDRSGNHYHLLKLEEAVAFAANESTERQLLFEKLPETAHLQRIWFEFSVDGIPLELAADLEQATAG